MIIRRNWRFSFLIGIFLLLTVALMGRLFYLQIWNHKYYSAIALGQQAGFSQSQGKRGEVFLENSQQSKGASASEEFKSLAINKDTYDLAAIVKNIKDKETFAAAVAGIMGEEPAGILGKISTDSDYVVLKKNITADQVKALRQLALLGVEIQTNPGRYYPQQSLAAQVIGFVGGDVTGQYGIEGYYEDDLKGKLGVEEVKRGFEAIGSTQSSLDGADAYLTIDYNIQFQAEQMLAKAAEKLHMASGQIVVMKPDSGRILAMANYPAFDPNTYRKETDYGIFQNAVVQKVFEPGSVFKPFTMAMALNEGRITPDTTFVDTGSVTIGPDTIYNFDHEKYGLSDMSRILEKSINTGAVWVSQQISRPKFLEYMEKFGFTQKTGIDLQGEIYSRNAALQTGYPAEFATASFGQGISMTPIQLVQAFSAFANGGKMSAPYIVDKISKDGSSQVTQPDTSAQIISAESAKQVTQMMVNVVEKGFGNIARVPGYYLAGKTGTAQVPMENKKGYYENKTIQSFIGFGPAYDPQFVILVKLDDPQVPKSSLSAAPIFGQLAQYIINYWQIPPDYEVGK